MPVLIPFPKAPGLVFTEKLTGKNIEWYTSILVSSDWAGVKLAPEEQRIIDLSVRPCSVEKGRTCRFPEDGDYARWCVDILPGDYLVHYALSVDRDYFDGDSHWKFPQLEREAIRQSASPWLGTARSNTIEIQWASELD